MVEQGMNAAGELREEASPHLTSSTHEMTSKDQIVILIGLNALYIGFGMVMGMVNGGLPTVMRAQGVGIGAAGWLYILYLPFGLTFLWAPLIDRLKLPFLSHRLGWIVCMQTLAAFILLIVGFNEGLALWGVFGLGLSIAFAIATMDIALDALAVQCVRSDWRPIAAATKLSALSVGVMIGGGAFVALFQTLGWQTIFLLMVGVLVLLLIPALFLKKYDVQAQKTIVTMKQSKASLFRLLRQGKTRNRLLLLVFICCVIFPLAGLNRLMLIDIGVSVEKIGWIVGTLGPLSMLATSVLSVPLMRFQGLLKSAYLFLVLTFIAVAALLYGFYHLHMTIAVMGTVLTGAGISGIYIVVTSKIIGWSVGTQPATDYAVYYGLGRFTSTLMTVGAAQIIPFLGWGMFYSLGVFGLLAVLFILYNLIGNKE